MRTAPKRLPAKYFYDEPGSKLFERITTLPEYYPTRVEAAILTGQSAAIQRLVPAGACLVEFGSGSSAKTRILLRALQSLSAYVPVDISAAFLKDEAARLQVEFEHLAVTPVTADFTRPFELPDAIRGRPTIGFFPGSTIGNFEPREACTFLTSARSTLGPNALLIVGVDLVKDPVILHRAYNDSEGITAAFNLNLLARMNNELGANFDLDAFMHRAFFDPARQRIEMHLVSKRRQSVSVAGTMVAFEKNETIHTENSYKYAVEQFGALSRQAGWSTAAVWVDERQYFSVHALRNGGRARWSRAQSRSRWVR